MLRYLISELGVDPVARDNDGLTTLHAATQGGHLDAVKVQHSIASCDDHVCVGGISKM